METFLNSKGERVESASMLNEKEVVLAERLTNALSEQYGPDDNLNGCSS